MKKISIILWILIIPLISYSQGFSFTITNDILLRNGTPHSLSYENNTLCFFDKAENKIHFIDLQGDIVREIGLENSLNGISLFKDTLWELGSSIANNIVVVNLTQPETRDIYKSINWELHKPVDECEFITVNNNSFFSCTYAGWSSSIVQISKLGTQINSIFIPGHGFPAGIACNSVDNIIYYLVNTGENSNGFLYDYEFSSNGIQNTFITEIPVKNPRGIACVNDNIFYVYSDSDKKIYELTKLKSPVQKVLISKNVTIYPNPVKDGKLMVKFTENRDGNIRICSITGQELINQKITGQTQKIDVSKLTPGHLFC